VVVTVGNNKQLSTKNSALVKFLLISPSCCELSSDLVNAGFETGYFVLLFFYLLNCKSRLFQLFKWREPINRNQIRWSCLNQSCTCWMFQM